MMFITLLTTMGASLHAASTEAGKVEQEQISFFESKVRPILVKHCYNCHSAETKPSGGLRVDDRNGLLMGGDEGPAIVLGDADKSLLLQRILHSDPKKKMPREGDALTDAEVADLSTWINHGAAWPRERVPPSLLRANPAFEKLKQTHWAWQPLTQPKVPAVQNATWPRSDVDRFVLAKLEEKKLAPVAEADRLTLLRRITYDLTGLPPTPEEITAFTHKDSKQTFEQVVDRLLNSPAYGERWGRHWLDVARYGESTGPSRNIPYPHAWKYRDYVLDSVNRDVPYNRFVQEQIAGDLLPAKDAAEQDRLLTATGFLALGVKDVNQRFKTRFIMDNVDEQIDAVSRSVLALTVNCARCHDHKYDPISSQDYYALAGIFTSTDNAAGVRNKMGGGGLDYYDPANLVRLTTAPPPAPEAQVKGLQAKVDEAKKAWNDVRGTPKGLKKGPDGRPLQRSLRVKYDNLQAELLNLTDPATRGGAVHGVREAKAVADTELRIRGEAERLGPTIERGFLSVLKVPNAPAIPKDQSGRLELAQWLTSPENPLTPRVFANRIWQHLFGQGLVTTVDNFGINGDTPSHPELLDYLAQQVIRQGWSTKQLIRSLVLTRSYQLGTDAPTDAVAVDPANRLVWRHSPRRLDAEEVRDSLLLTSGNLAAKPEQAGVKTLRMVEMRDNGAEAKTIQETSNRSLSRSVYLPLLRGVTPASLEAFDPVEQTLVTGQRAVTTVATQALYLMNSNFVQKQSLALAEHLLQGKDKPGQTEIRQAYLRVLGREPNPSELNRVEDFLADYEIAYADAPSSRSEKPVSSDIVIAATETTTTEVVDPDNIDRTPQQAQEEEARPSSPRAAAWMNFVQALYATAEFRFVQ